MLLSFLDFTIHLSPKKKGENSWLTVHKSKVHLQLAPPRVGPC